MAITSITSHKGRVLSALEIALIAVLISVTAGAGLYSHYTLNKVRQGLPEEILVRARDLTLLIQDLAALVHAVELAVVDAESQRRQEVINRNGILRNRLAHIRSNYVFNNLVGAAALHALINPASEDIQRWLTQGLPGIAIDSPTVMHLVETRARNVLERAQDLALQGNVTALELLHNETRRLEDFQGGMLLLLVCLAVLTLVVIGLFISQRRVEARLAVLREQLSDAIESIPEGFVLCDADDRLVVCNERFRRLYSDLGGLIIPGAPFVRLMREFFRSGLAVGSANCVNEALVERMTKHYQPGAPFEQELKDGRRIRISERRTRDGGVVGIHVDISDVRRIQERLRYLANHDFLTGLPNRNYFEERMEQALARARRHDLHFAVLYLDLDRFKLINDTLGHHAGDEVLQAVAGRLKSHLREEDTLARLGGDEFIVILEDLQDASLAMKFAQRIVDALGRPFQVAGHEVFVTSSIGVAHFPANGDTIQTLMQNADAASYHAKSQGLNKFQVYTPEIKAKSFQRFQLESDLHHALERDELVLYFQPRLNIGDGRLVGVEALLRWRHPQQGLLTPAHFIDIAEETGLIIPIGQWALQQACEQFCSWRIAGLSLQRIAVNLSPRQLNQPNLRNTVIEILDATGTEPDNLELEITENALTTDLEAGISILRELGALGVHLAIDDFGRGYSSLSVLPRLPLEAVKIDHYFIGDIVDSVDGTTIVNAIVAMARALEIKVVAEGIENRMQLEALRKRGCNEGQGDYFCKPQPAAELTRYLESFEPKPADVG